MINWFRRCAVSGDQFFRPMPADRLHHTFLSFAAFLTFLSCLSSAEPDQGSRASGARLSTLEFAAAKVLEIHPQTVDGFSNPVAAALEEARAQASIARSDEEQFFVTNRWLAALEDAHLELRVRDAALSRMDCAPLPLRAVPEGLAFSAQTEKVSRGDLLVNLGHLGVDDIYGELASVIPVENDGRLRFLVAQRLKLGLYLRYLGVVDEDDHVVVQTEGSDGERSTYVIDLAPCESPDLMEPWVGFDIHEEASLGVFWFNRFDYNKEMVDAMERFFQQVDEKNLLKVAVDLRQKEGGDVTVAFAFLSHFEDLEWESFSVETRISDALAEAVPAFGRQAMSDVFVGAGLPPIPKNATTYVLPAPLVKAFIGARMAPETLNAMTRVRRRELFLISDAGTFSSGTLFAALLRDNGIGQIVGEPTGNAANFNGSELRFDLPSTDYYLNISSARLTRPDPTRGAEPAIEPDVSIPTTQADIATGNDPQLQYLISRPITQ